MTSPLLLECTDKVRALAPNARVNPIQAELFPNDKC